MTNIAIVGAGGRMGAALVRCAARMPELSVVAALEQPGHAALGRDTGTLAGIAANGVVLTDDAAALKAADVQIDFSFHEAVPAAIDRAVDFGNAVVLGTTGLSAEETQRVHEAATRIPIVWAPNMSLGMNLLFAMVQRAAQTLNEDYDVEIVEVHHRHKKDAPSGTALRLAEAVAEGRGRALDAIACFGREGQTGERPRGQIGIHAVRSGDVVGEHTVSFGTEGECLEFRHRASTRDAFAIGALKAAGWVKGRSPRLYDMKDVLGL